MREPKHTDSYKVKELELSNIKEKFNFIKFKIAPREHQWRSLALGILHDTFLFALDMGLGKSKIAIDLISIRKKLEGIKQALVICPAIVLYHWEKEIEKHSDLSCVVVDGRTFTDKIEVFNNKKVDIVIVSFTWLTHLYRFIGRKEKLQKLIDERIRKFDFLVIDEAHNLKNPKTKSFKGCRRYFSKIKYRYLLTGMPVGNDYSGVWSLYYLLDFGKTFGIEFYGFIKKFFFVKYINNQFPVYMFRQDKKKDFNLLFWKKAVRWEETDCNDLPSKTFIEIPLKMTSIQTDDYKDIEASIISLGGMYKLMYITAGINYMGGEKLKAAIELVKEKCIEQKKKFIIWHWLKGEGEMLEVELKKTFKDLRIESIRGGVGKHSRILKNWKAGFVDVLIANTRSLGIGVDLFEADSCCFYSNTLSLIDRKQAEKRIHRTGQENPCFYYDLICEGTIDQAIVNLLRKSKVKFADLTGDKMRDITEAELLQELKKVKKIAV